MGKLDGRVVLITGAANGQGAATARLFAAEGARVLLTDIVDDRGKALAGELGDNTAYTRLDIRREDDWAYAVAYAVERFGKLDGLVNNAGVVAVGSIEDTSAADFMSIVETNQLGVYLGIRAVIAALREAGGGTIVNTSSVDGLIGMKFLSAYSASKFAVNGLTRVAAMELGPSRIRVNALCPGVIATDINADLHEWAVKWFHKTLPLRRFGQAEEMAAIALFLTGDDSSYITGTEIVADGGWLAGHLTP